MFQSKKKENSTSKLHFNCRNNIYKGNKITVPRFPVPDNKVHWEIEWPCYKPIIFTDNQIKSETWADPEIDGNNYRIKFNIIDRLINRISYLGHYSVVDSYPLNPMGRTGIRGRGILGKWGPNHSVLAVVTRWKPVKKSNQNVTGLVCKKSILQFVGVQYLYENQLFWGFPGGFIDLGESLNTALKREFLEEATNYIKANTSEKKFLLNLVNFNLINGKVVYTGYDDSSRNTDNAWIEVTAVHFHEGSNNTFGFFPLIGNDGFLTAKWVDIDKNLFLSSTNKEVMDKIIFKMNCHY